MKDNLINFSNTVNDWYTDNKRDLPWRDTTNPYIIWLSEIILQQTRVEQGMSYFYKFSTKYPTVHDLASASEDEVLKDWEGLGYYSRGRNMLATAKYISVELKGIFPSTYKEIIQLKGVGSYTAAAISSFAFNEEQAVVDGNVYRILSRFFGISTPIDSTGGKKEFQKLADQLIALQNPSDHNQAMMEFGSMQCTPKKPDCEKCPLQSECFAFQKGLISELPVKAKKTKQTKRYFTYLIYIDKDSILIQKRPEKGIWANMYEFPLLESKSIKEQDLLIKEQKWLQNDKIKVNRISDTHKHILSHQQLFAKFVELEVDHISIESNNQLIIKQQELKKYALPKLLVNYISERDDLLYLLNDN